MEKAVLKTLIYADIFDYPLKAWEIHKWIIGKKCDLLDVEKALFKLTKKKKIILKDDLYALKNRKEVFAKRKNKSKISQQYFKKAKLITNTFKFVPWIKLVGISGGLAMENASGGDDIDLFIITSNDRIWISRSLLILVLTILGQRRKAADNKQEAAGKICLNLILQEDALEQKRKDLYIAHEVLQMVPLWQRGETYTKYLDSNSWAFKFLPNWTTGDFTQNDKSLFDKLNPVDVLEKAAKLLQLQFMSKPKGGERIEDNSLYFHPKDKRNQVIETFKQRTK